MSNHEQTSDNAKAQKLQRADYVQQEPVTLLAFNAVEMNELEQTSPNTTQELQHNKQSVDHVLDTSFSEQGVMKMSQCENISNSATTHELQPRKSTIVSHFEEAGIEEESQPPYKPSCLEKSLECCCQSYKCCGKGKGEDCITEADNLLTGPLRKAKSLGKQAIEEALFNTYVQSPMCCVTRELFVFLQLFLAIFSFVPALMQYLDHTNGDNPFRALFAGSLFQDMNQPHMRGDMTEGSGSMGLGSGDEYDGFMGFSCDNFLLACLITKLLVLLFSLLDTLYSLYRCTCKIKRECCKCMKKSHQEEIRGKKSNKCKSCWCTTKSINKARVIVIAMLLYPDLLTSMFVSSIDYTDGGDGYLNISLYSWLHTMGSASQTFLSVYLSQAFILTGSICSLSKIRNIKWNGACFHIYFVVYCYSQMILQVVMIVAIGVRFYHENLKREFDFYEETSCSFSGYLWYMMAFAYVFPVLSTIMFFIVHHYWAQKLQMDVYKDMVSNLLKEENAKILSKVSEESMEKTMQSLNDEEFGKDYDNYAKASCVDKFQSPFLSPFCVIVCLLYTTFLLAFTATYFIGVSYSSTWIYFALAILVYGMLVNIYAVGVAAFYAIIIISVITVIVMMVVFVVTVIASIFLPPWMLTVTLWR